MDALTAFGLLSVSAMLVCYALEDRAHWFVRFGRSLRFAAGAIALRPSRLGPEVWTCCATKSTTP
jgi:hypothetical protein